MAKKALTQAALAAALKRGTDTGRDVWMSDDSSERGAGRLRFRAMSNGAGRWLWRYTVPGGEGITRQIVIGAYSPEPRENHYTLKEARGEVVRLAAMYQRPESRDVRAYLEAESAALSQAKAHAERAEAARIDAEAKAAEDAERHTLARLFEAYVGHLTKQGKQSAYDARNLFALHVTKAHPATATKPARDVTGHDVTTVLRTLTEAGKGRTAGKLRAYLRAAYALAARAELDADAPAAFLPFKVEANPVAATGTLAKFNRTRERALSEPELREFWKALDATPDSPTRDALQLLVLLGGHRPAQLLRATTADVDTAAKLLTLRDPKGKRQHPRVHVLPLTPDAEAVVARCLARAEAQADAGGPGWLFSTRGKAVLRPETVTAAFANIAATLLAKPKAARVVREPFELRDIRRTCETRLAALGVSKDTRAHIQSHGLGGVQSRHYDKYHYLPEKTEALTAWTAYLAQKPTANVREIKQKSVA